MIWIATLCLLCIAAWLVLSGLNERQWVNDHSHDETVAADPGFIPDMKKVADKGRELKGKMSLEDDNTPMSRAVTKVQEKSSRVGERLGTVARAAKVDDAQAVRYAGPTGAALVGAAAAKVGVDTEALGQKVKERAANTKERALHTLEARQGADGIVGKVAGTVSAGVDKVSAGVDKVAQAREQHRANRDNQDPS